jgi:hypothetical protein
MRPVTLDEGLLDELAKARGDALVSVLIPTHVKGPDVAQDRIRLKNALTEIDGMLSDAGWRRVDREARLERARALLDDDDFWAHQGSGLALYVDDTAEILPVALADEPPALATIADCYHIRHLLPGLMRTPLPALVLTKGAVALYTVESVAATAVDADLPASFEDVNWFIERERFETRHADARGSAGVQHGHDPADRTAEDLLRFLRAVAQALDEHVDRGPVVVLGDEPVIDDFRKVTDRPVIGLRLDGTHRTDSPAEIWRSVSPVIEDRKVAELSSNRDAACEALGTADTVTMFPDALYAAASGRLSHLYLRRDIDPIWGRFEPAALDAAAGTFDGVGSVDLLDRLAATARATGAKIRPMEGDADGCDFVGVRRF